MKLLMCRPTFYDVVYEINPWMNKNIAVHKLLAQRQWDQLVHILTSLNVAIQLIDPAPNLPDLVFTANAGLALPHKIILAHFKYPERQPEAAHFAKWFKQAGYEVTAEPSLPFEGAGDTLFAGKRLFAGFNFRSDRQFFINNPDLTGIEITLCELVSSHFYHLDTCFCPLNEHQALWYPEAFSASSQQLMQSQIELLAVPPKEARNFACNAVVIGNNVVIPSHCPATKKLLINAGFNVYACDMSEFIKAGGACKCLTLYIH